MSFPTDFIWGAAASSYQIEGAWDLAGKGPSVWDMFAHQPNRIAGGHTGDIACDHYHDYREDIAIMKKMGLKAYRLSISWPRVLPDGEGRVNESGLAFYDKLIEALLEAGIEPWVTLFHWDYPYALFLRGGWLNSESPKWFADFTRLIIDRLSDRVTNWITLNEPQCYLGLGHLTGDHAPGLRLGLREALLAGHHSLMAHGLAVQIIRALAKRPPRIGWAPVTMSYYPKKNSSGDIAAARKMTLSVSEKDFWNNIWWGDPPILGHYPEEGLRAYGKAVPKFRAQDFDTIRQPIDFYGCNIYTGVPVEAGESGEPAVLEFPAGHPSTHFLWKVAPQGIYWGPKFLHERYKLPIVITENGLSCHDWLTVDGRVHDQSRIDFLTRYLRELHRAVADGIPVEGYFHWSLMDNFEWAEGYKHRFGLVHVDFETRQRTPKDSAHWYAEVIRTNGDNLLEAPPKEVNSRVEDLVDETA